jgi:transglutaminase-like putative cysteine protease
VVEAHSEIRKTPVDTGLQHVVTHRIDVEPAATLRSRTDYFGTRVHHVNVLEPHVGLEIHSEAVVQTSDAIWSGPGENGDPRPWTQRLAEYLHESPLVPWLAEYGEIGHRVAPDLAPEAFLDALRELSGAFRKRFRYDPDATDVNSSPKVLFERGGGVCQDLAHAMLGVLRLAGVACRYVSGYVYDPAGDEEGCHLRGARASHAWVQAWHPGLGWVGIDPTNDRLVDWQYVFVAAGRDYSDVQPLRGVFVGPLEQRLEVEVSVKRIG